MVNKEQLSQMTDSQKLNYLVEKIDRIDRKVNPPKWKKFLWWCQSHWVIMFTLFGILYGLYTLWDELQMLISFVQTMNQSIQGIKGFGGDVGSGIGNAADSVIDTVKNLKFWE
ncbi:MAG TPA: hypothetical protein VIT68_03685 [Candidatus Gracilibacteria bacterium]